jgi:hypothetical protein
VFIDPLDLLLFSIVQVTVFGRFVAVLSEFEKMIQAAGSATHILFIYLFIFLSFPFFFFFLIYIHTHKLPKSDTQLINKTNHP